MARAKATECSNGHAYDAENTYLYKGKQACRTCRKDAARRYREANREQVRIENAKWAAANRDLSRAASRRWAQENPEKRRANLIRRYGITPERFDEMHAAQGGKCAICAGTDSGDSRFGTLHIDHDHETGAVRGLLCGRCNRAIGMMKDDPDRLLSAAAYLLQYVDILKEAHPSGRA